MIRVLGNKQLAPFLKRHMQMSLSDRDLRLDAFLRLALQKADEFVPSESGSIFLDDPVTKAVGEREHNKLCAVACFGPRSQKLLGKEIPANRGIVGRVYVSGQAYFSRDVRKDPYFAAEFDRETGHKTRSILCVPISIRSSMVGVLELINKKGARPYSIQDFELLKIFADYISASIQNFLDARRHAEMAKRDNLTGLSNDRQFHAVLKRDVAAAWRKKKDVSLIFIDLDRFKSVNDEHGHLAGSRVLFEVAEILRESIQWPRAEIARYGGDEYVVVLPGAGVLDAVNVAENARRAVERAVFLSEPSQDVPAVSIADQIKTSIGVASLLTHVGSGDRNALLHAADEAMYAAKRAGGNKVVVAQARVLRGTEVTQ